MTDPRALQIVASILLVTGLVIAAVGARDWIVKRSRAVASALILAGLVAVIVAGWVLLAAPTIAGPQP
jgi:hypothetical protein